MLRNTLILTALFAFIPAVSALAGDAPQEVRHEMMEDVGGAAKTIGAMLKGEAAFDAPEANAALEVWAEAAWDFGKLFPEGSETGFDTEAAPAIWTDRAGFDEQLQQFSAATEAAVEAGPQDLEALKAAAGPVFKVCKSCHESYRIED